MPPRGPQAGFPLDEPARVMPVKRTTVEAPFVLNWKKKVLAEMPSCNVVASAAVHV